MSHINQLSPDQLERRQARLKRKELWEKVWTVVLLTLAGLFLIWYIITVISHHV